jgi:hypothetical protein
MLIENGCIWDFETCDHTMQLSLDLALGVVSLEGAQTVSGFGKLERPLQTKSGPSLGFE